MAISNAITDTFKEQLLLGAMPNSNTYKLALYTSTAVLGATSNEYNTTNECAGTGNYTQGGVALVNWKVYFYAANNRAYLDADDVAWGSSTITARGAMIYNSSKAGGNNTVAVFNFGASDIVSSNGTFTVSFPAPGADGSTAVIRLA